MEKDFSTRLAELREALIEILRERPDLSSILEGSYIILVRGFLFFHSIISKAEWPVSLAFVIRDPSSKPEVFIFISEAALGLDDDSLLTTIFHEIIHAKEMSQGRVPRRAVEEHEIKEAEASLVEDPRLERGSGARPRLTKQVISEWLRDRGVAINVDGYMTGVDAIAPIMNAVKKLILDEPAKRIVEVDPLNIIPEYERSLVRITIARDRWDIDFQSPKTFKQPS